MNNSVMKCCICDNKNIGEFITINDEKYHLCCIEQLHKENQELKKQLEENKNPLKGIFAQVTDDQLLRENGLLYAENKKYKEVIDKATNELFILKDMIYKPETREENFEIQRKISSIIKRLNGKEVE